MQEYFDLVKEITEELRTEESPDNFSAWVELGLRTNKCSEKVVPQKERKCRVAAKKANVEHGDNVTVVDEIASSVIKIAPFFKFPEL